MTFCSELKKEENEGSNRQDKPLRVAEKPLTILEALPTHMDWKQIFCLPNEMHQHVVSTLQHPELYTNKVKYVGGLTESLVKCVSCNIAVTFIVDDLLLGSKCRNRLLFVTCYIREQKVKRILVDRGSTINIMPKSTMDNLGITMEELSKSQTIIKGLLTFSLN